MKYKRQAFTLAETLITLTIIGVVAALTIPTLAAKYQKHTYVTGLKKAYSQLSNAFKMIPISEGCSAGDYECAWHLTDYPNDDFIYNEPIVIKSFAQQFKTVKSDFWYDGANPQEIPCVSLGEEKACYGSFTTQDGMKYSNSFAIFQVDVNGDKGPNKMNRDQFSFMIFKTNGKWELVPSGTEKEIWSSTFDCTTENVNNWSGYEAKCTEKVLRENAMNY